MTPVDLKAAREALGLTQRALAERLGVPHTTIWRWETGRHKIERPAILALALRSLLADAQSETCAAKVLIERLMQD